MNNIEANRAKTDLYIMTNSLYEKEPSIIEQEISFPFNNKSYEDEDYDDEDDYIDHCDSGYEWTDEDAWDAYTDGQYGDYPGSDWDPEMFGY